MVTARSDGPLAEVRFLVAEAARHGHEDAERLLDATAGRRVSAADMEEPEYAGELRLALGLTSRTEQQPVRVHTPTAVNAALSADRQYSSASGGIGRLVPVPVQRVARHDTGPSPA
ncbi:hypothetical protein ACFQ7O_23515 [Streptomyces sp. NPDC056485]|uniref:hypothetical protein n=1 Tax=Streptomyces sp. NPDC056485 TaxID=3345834 RepID=UPI00367CE62F